jgi:hypothetical protein
MQSTIAWLSSLRTAEKPMAGSTVLRLHFMHVAWGARLDWDAREWLFLNPSEQRDLRLGLVDREPQESDLVQHMADFLCDEP